MKRRSELRRKTPLKSSGWTPGQFGSPIGGLDGEAARPVAMTGRRPLPKVSARRRKRDAVYPAAREAVFARSGGVCEIGADGCTGQASEVHHVAGRGGPDPHRLSNLLAGCPSCHRHAHANPALSYQRGWMQRRVA